MVAEEAAAEEAAAATEETTAAKPEKEEMAEGTSKDEAFNFQNLVDQELTKAEKEELKENINFYSYSSLLIGLFCLMFSIRFLSASPLTRVLIPW